MYKRQGKESTNTEKQIIRNDHAILAGRFGRINAMVQMTPANRNKAMICLLYTSAERIGRQEMKDYYSMWAHQIKTPIAAMKVLAQAAGDTEDARTYELLQDMQTELFKTEQYVEMVLTYVRMEDMSGDLMRCV